MIRAKINPRVIFLLSLKPQRLHDIWRKSKTVTWNDREMKIPIWLIKYPIESKYWVERIHFNLSAKQFEFKHFQIIFNMQHHLRVHFLSQAQFYDSKIMVPLYFSKTTLRKRHFVSRLINRKLSFNSNAGSMTFVFSCPYKLTIKTLNKFYNNKISALTTKWGCWVCNLLTHMPLRHVLPVYNRSHCSPL